VPPAKTDHPLVRKAQDLPDEVQASGAERIVSIDDRVWFKVKTRDHRGAGGTWMSARTLESSSGPQ